MPPGSTMATAMVQEFLRASSNAPAAMRLADSRVIAGPYGLLIMSAGGRSRCGVGKEAVHHGVSDDAANLSKLGRGPRRIHAIGEQDDHDLSFRVDPDRRPGEP